MPNEVHTTRVSEIRVAVYHRQRGRQHKVRKGKDVRSCQTNRDGMPYMSSPGAGEDRIHDGLEEIDILKERYRQAVEYIDWFRAAWEQLAEDERYCLETFYGDENTYGSNAAYSIAVYLNVEQPTAYKRKNRALDRLTVLLFGKS